MLIGSRAAIPDYGDPLLQAPLVDVPGSDYDDPVLRAPALDLAYCSGAMACSGRYASLFPCASEAAFTTGAKPCLKTKKRLSMFFNYFSA